LEGLRSGFGRTSLSKAVVELLTPMLNEAVYSGEFSKMLLVKIIRQTQNQSEEMIGYIGGNALTLFSKSTSRFGFIGCGIDLNLDLSRTIILGANIKNSSLSGVNLSHSTIRGCK
jgi:uncharacterized protein YjbI with pentapeptide repeats